ncbi:NACHT, LRR and PYD domains-containing protein 12 isoform X1 [Canis lupus familiaris]|uniref:NLR family pyrin domain containing 12 n=3 Tax=Canis lupus familiaris TaxID=9615 RepID=A0A8C0RUY7_CANLF|nr:NACHT, LRR and PYD domains-containing protein 12 isoform X1 [Canis lupus familiaris]XP_038383682.1 NACHT, LRR and PYD domains-containing protein 12 isoform X1 [Canis lupus familiaris]XP_038511757.1 NACHT, LRR and PYD domains-containing protein 12 isoform X1 [Canis lupus familiaris]|eukprot:XP_003432686.1 NACHT, LRR and PYD domains-containing protein 12 isoform X1 [Canis lupus familiaris]
MPRAPPSSGLCRLSAYLEELEAVELKKFKLFLGTEAEAGRIPWGRLEAAGPLDTAQLLVAHCGPHAAWPLALGLFQRINRRDLWEKGRREEPVRDTPSGDPSSPGSQSACSLEVFPGALRRDPRETYRDYVRRKFRLMEDRNARLGECVNLSHRYTRLLLVKEHSNPMWAQQKLLDTGWGQARTVGHQASFIQMETLFEPDEERPEPPRTVVLQGAAGMGKSMLAHKVMLDWADGRLFQDRFDYLFYINCRKMNQSTAEQSAQDLISSCWPEPSVPLQELVRVPERLLFIIDGFHELKPSFHDPQGPWCLCWEEKRPTELLLSSLIRKKLLPELSVLITIRPTALEKLHRLLEHPRHVEILGFSEAERKEYFYKYFHNAEQAGQVFNFIRDNEPLFTLCFVPMVCWVVCTCLKQQLEDGGLLRQTSRTTTAVYMLYLLSLMQPKPGSPILQSPPNQRGLCSLAADGLWNQKILFEEQDLRKHGLDGADVSSFLNMNIFQKDINCEKFYSFIHLSFQEFFAAMYYILDPGESRSSPEHNVTRLLAEYEFSERSFLALTVRFLFGLLNEETRSYLEKSLCWKVSPHVKVELLEWIQRKAQSEGSTLQQGSLELFSCLYEIQEEDFIQQALSPFQVVVVNNIATKMEHMISSFCVKNCRSALVLHLHGAAYSPDEDDGGRWASGPQMLPTQIPEKNVLPDAYSKQLAAALSTNPNLTELVLYRSALGSRGVRLLCQGLRHPSCKLQNLSLKRCCVASSACQDLAAALMANQNLRRMDLSSNRLGLPGLRALCKGLRHPRCKLQVIQLRKCQLEAEACQEIASVLSTSRHLEELDLTGNALEDLGLKLLCQGLRHPVCRLQILWLKICHLTAAACEDLASTLGVNQSLIELDLSLNDLGDPGVLLLCEGLRHPQCRLQALRLGICRLSSAACKGLCTVLQVNPCLRDLDLSFNDLGDAGVWPLCEGLRHPTCRLQKLWLDSCGLTAKACEDLSSALGVSQTLRELYLTNNALGNAGVRLLCKGLSHPGCKLQVLWLFGMELNKMTHRRLAALRVVKPQLDIGC